MPQGYSYCRKSDLGIRKSREGRGDRTLREGNSCLFSFWWNPSCPVCDPMSQAFVGQDNWQLVGMGFLETWAAPRVGSRPNWGVLSVHSGGSRRGFDDVAKVPVRETFHLFNQDMSVWWRTFPSSGNWLNVRKQYFPASCTSQKTARWIFFGYILNVILYHRHLQEEVHWGPN